jgi:CyaY protein
MDEKRYRRFLDLAFARIDAGFEDVDPDVAECTIAQGALTILFAGGRRLIVSPQTPVRQIWVAFKDRAWHMNHDDATDRWVDDRGEGVELFALIERLAADQAPGLRVTIRRHR